MIINPNNSKRELDLFQNEKYFKNEVTDRMPKMYAICICIWSVLALISILTVKRNPSFVIKEQIRETNSSQ